MKYLILLSIFYCYLFADNNKTILDLNKTYKIPEEEIIAFANAPLPPKSIQKNNKISATKKSYKKHQNKDIKIIKGLSSALVSRLN